MSRAGDGIVGMGSVTPEVLDDILMQMQKLVVDNEKLTYNNIAIVLYLITCFLLGKHLRVTIMNSERCQLITKHYVQKM